MRTCTEYLNFTPCKTDPDAWMHQAIKDTDGTSYWEYVLLYANNTICISMNPQSVLEKEIGRYWMLKEGLLGPPTIYLGNKVSHVQLENGVTAWSFSSSLYVQEIVKNLEAILKKKINL